MQETDKRNPVLALGLDQDIQDAGNKCFVQQFEESQFKEPLMPHVAPGRPWKMVGTDKVEFEFRTYLVTVDYY